MRTSSGQYQTATHTAVSVAITDTAVLPANRSRQYAAFINDSANVVYLNFSGAAAANIGIRLNANGGIYEMNAGEGNLYQGAIRAIALTGASTLLVTEGT